MAIYQGWGKDPAFMFMGRILRKFPRNIPVFPYCLYQAACNKQGPIFYYPMASIYAISS